MKLIQLVSLTILMVNAQGAKANMKNMETMIAAESDGHYIITNYSNDDRVQGAESTLFDMIRQVTSPKTTLASPSTTRTYYRRPAFDNGYVTNNVKDIYKKDASEYWEHEIPPHHGSSMTDESGYGGGSEVYGGVHGGYLKEENGYHKGKEISITPDHKPITLHYRTHAQPIMVHQTRIPGPKPEVKHTTSQEEPHRVVHEVIRPIIQEVHEIIQPYRRVVQQVQPVIEEVRTVIAKDAGKSHMTGGGDRETAYEHKGQGDEQVAYAEDDMQLLHSHKPYRKAPLYEKSLNDDDSQEQEIGYPKLKNKIRRSKAYINRHGIPVYESKYHGPVGYQSS